MVMTAWLVGVVFDLRLVVPEREVNLTFTLLGSLRPARTKRG
jgi:hypothetical protein